MWEGVGDRTELQHMDPHSYGHQRFFPVLLGCSARSLGAQSLWDMFLNPASYPQLVWSPNCSIGGLRGPSAGCWLSLPHLISNWSGLQTNWLPVFSELYNSSTPLLLVGVTIALIQPIHGQGYNSDIPRPDASVIYIGAFPILTAQPGRRSMYNNSILPR